MAITPGVRGRVISEKTHDFSRIRSLEEIPALSQYIPDTKKNAKIRELFLYLWCRCKNRNTGDCKFKTTDMAEVLEVTERSVYRYLDKLEKFGFISRLTTRRFTKIDHTDAGVFSATRFIRVHAAMYHTHYNLVPSNTQCWDNDNRPDSSESLKKIPLKYKVKHTQKFQGKYGEFEVNPLYAYGKSDINLSGFYFQNECAQPGKDIVQVEAWHTLDMLQDDADDMAGYPGQAKALKIIGRSFKDRRTKYVMKSRYIRDEKIARQAVGNRWVKEPIEAKHLWDNFDRTIRSVS